MVCTNTIEKSEFFHNDTVYFVIIVSKYLFIYGRGLTLAGRISFGLILVIFGTGFLLHQLNVIDFIYILKMWWPVLFIWIGITQLMNRTQASSTTGFIFIIIGGFLLANKWTTINITSFIIPFILILIGIVIVLTPLYRRRKAEQHDTINSNVIFSGDKIRAESTQLRGGNISAIFGGSEIDLRDCQLSEDGASIDVFTMFGGVNIIVPQNVHVNIKGIRIFGGWSDRTGKIKDAAEKIPTLTIHCTAIFGGVEIHH